MARLISLSDAGITAITPISGPMARNSGSNTAQDGSEQVYAGVGDVVALNVEFNHKQGLGVLAQRGRMIGVHGGANAFRMPVFDPDMISPREAGLDVPARLGWTSLKDLTWSNGMPWSNGMGWQPTAPTVKIAASAAYGSHLVRLADEHWGHRLPLGSWFGFFPFHFGLYTVTEERGDGWYRIWPRLRKALTTDDFATLHPVIVMRPRPGILPPRRGLAVTDEFSIDLVEVIDPYVRRHFVD